ncbi:MAG: GNAT family N-acetyltransferase, partial [Actinomycetota bacterium]|nr:GNAT family N-acetyltransferase [Actinomycetota bacterium]
MSSPPELAVRTGVIADAQDIGRLLHAFNLEFDDPTPGPQWLAERIRELLRHGQTAVLLGGE